MDLIGRFFGKDTKSRSPEKGKASDRDIRIATCALLLEMAGVDGEFSPDERERIMSILKRDFQMPDEYAAELLEATSERLRDSIDIWQFTNLINENYSREEKIRIIEMVWKIIYTDGKLDSHEDYLVHKLANLLQLTHIELIDAKLKILHQGG
ncbi:MAG: TerB family tellurite resistance protein [Deltaproteobacteria bacterium]|nr:TerB family tellurite resistance protein [Deltaproteobacteria bacterium]